MQRRDKRFEHGQGKELRMCTLRISQTVCRSDGAHVFSAVPSLLRPEDRVARGEILAAPGAGPDPPVDYGGVPPDDGRGVVDAKVVVPFWSVGCEMGWWRDPEITCCIVKEYSY